MNNSGKVTVAAGSAGAIGSATTMTGITAGLSAPLANLGGYATAQVIASSIGVGGGPALSAGIAAVGGPIVAGALASTGVGILVAGAGFGIYKLVKFSLR